MALKFSMTSDAKIRGVKVLVYSESGVGKTVLCSTAPDPLIISAESGLLSLRRHSIPVIEVKTIEDLTEVYNFCSSSPEAKRFQTLCLDSLTEVAEVVLANAKKQVKDPRQAYGELIDKMAMVVRSFRDIPDKNVYMSAKMEPYKDEMTGIIKYGPSMPGQKLGPQLPYYFDEVFRLGVGKTQQGDLFRFLQTQPDIQYVAKDRSGSLAAIEPPDLNAVFSKIRQ